MVGGDGSETGPVTKKNRKQDDRYPCQPHPTPYLTSGIKRKATTTFYCVNCFTISKVFNCFVCIVNAYKVLLITDEVRMSPDIYPCRLWVYILVPSQWILHSDSSSGVCNKRWRYITGFGYYGSI